MGSTFSGPSKDDSGTLQGAYAPPLPGIPLPPPLKGEKKFQVVVPEGKKGGDTMTVSVDGEHVDIMIPRIKADGRIYRPGDKFIYNHPGESHRVIASTLPSLPGTTIVESKPIIWASATQTFHPGRAGRGQSVGYYAAKLLQEAQGSLLEKTVDVSCNVVLGVTTNVAVDTWGERGVEKLIIVTMMGTPCNVVPVDTLPAVPAEAVLIPMHN